MRRGSRGVTASSQERQASGHNHDQTRPLHHRIIADTVAHVSPATPPPLDHTRRAPQGGGLAKPGPRHSPVQPKVGGDAFWR